MGAGKIISAIVFALIGCAIFALGLIQRKNSDVDSKPTALFDLLRPKPKSGRQGPMQGISGMILLMLVLIALAFYVLLMKR
jgi:ABC-type Na+ efflux pump permease subunit